MWNTSLTHSSCRCVSVSREAGRAFPWLAAWWSGGFVLHHSEGGRRCRETLQCLLLDHRYPGKHFSHILAHSVKKAWSLDFGGISAFCSLQIKVWLNRWTIREIYGLHFVGLNDIPVSFLCYFFKRKLSVIGLGVKGGLVVVASSVASALCGRSLHVLFYVLVINSWYTI